MASSTSGKNNDANVAMLASMGFDTAQAKESLQVCNGDLQAAANYLLSRVGGAAADPPCTGSDNANINRGLSGSNSNNSGISMVVGSINQYSTENGRSACTCIALTAAEKFLTKQQQQRQQELKQQQQQQQGRTSDAVVDAVFLQDMIVTGCQRYRDLPASTTIGTEHLSAEEVLAAGGHLASVLKMSGSIRQGLLSSDTDHPQGLRSQLANCQLRDNWLAVLITKTPETVLVCLPPLSDDANDDGSSSSSSSSYVLIDSHPRPQLFGGGVEQAYARTHATLNDLVRSLREIFPVTDLGPDISELMSSMYNSFDLYPLQLKA